MGKLPQLIIAWGAVVLVSAIGCSDDSEQGGGDGDEDQMGTGGFVTTSGGTSGDGDVIDPCFGALVYCNSGCVDLTSDDKNCGSCGERCGSNEICDDSLCIDAPDLSMGGDGGVGGGGGRN